MSMIGKMFICALMVNIVFTFLYPELIMPASAMPKDMFNDDVKGYSDSAKDAQPALVTAQTDSGGLTITDALRMVWDWIGFLLKFQIAPIIILSALGTPPIFILILAVPITILYLTSLVLLIRGVGG